MGKSLKERVEAIIESPALTDNEKYDLACLLELYVKGDKKSEMFLDTIIEAKKYLRLLKDTRSHIDIADVWRLLDILDYGGKLW